MGRGGARFLGLWVWLVVAIGLGVSTSTQGAEVLRDISYRPEASTPYERERCRLDLYLPESADDRGAFTTVVWFHGGGLIGGDKGGTSALGIAERFVAEGIAVAVPNYRLSPRVRYPDYLADAATACAFVRRTISEHGGDPTRVVISGHSAGGYLAAMLAMDRSLFASEGLEPTDFAGYVPVSGQMLTHYAVVTERGLPRTTPLLDSAAPAYHIGPGAPPILCIAGGDDVPARAEQNAFFVAAARGVEQEAIIYLEGPGRNHSTIVTQIGDPDDPVARAMLDFIAQHSSL